jgi:hypothetical protein
MIHKCRHFVLNLNALRVNYKLGTIYFPFFLTLDPNGRHTLGALLLT